MSPVRRPRAAPKRRQDVTYSDPKFVREQYRDTSNLDARLTLHERFGTNAQPWQRWVFDGLELLPDARVIELGCGPGKLWLENRDRIPAGWTVALTDASPGMLNEAEGRLGSDPRFSFGIADARHIPFEDGGFDAVVADHMLYHVPEREKAFSEISRVLKPGGALYATTNGEGTMREMGRFLRVLDPARPPDGVFGAHLGFSLENGAGQLSPWFPEVSLRRYEDALVVTETRPLVDYLLSGWSAATVAAGGLDAEEFRRRTLDLTAAVEKELASRGEIRITKDAGMFVARR